MIDQFQIFINWLVEIDKQDVYYLYITRLFPPSNYGPCEICGIEIIGQITYQLELQVSRRKEEYLCSSCFGHAECLKGSRKENDNLFVNELMKKTIRKVGKHMNVKEWKNE